MGKQDHVGCLRGSIKKFVEYLGVIVVANVAKAQVGLLSE